MKKIIGSIEYRKKSPINHKDLALPISTFLKKEAKLPHIYLHELNNVFVSPYGAIFKNGLLFPQVNYLNNKSAQKKLLSFYKKIAFGKKVKLRDDCLYISNTTFQNYYHWVNECLPKLMCILDELPNLTLIISKNIYQFHYDYLSLFTFKNIVFLEDNEIAYAKKLIIIDKITPNGEFYPNLINSLASYITTNTPDTNSAISSSKVYISRNKAQTRRIGNENKVYDFYKELGYDKIHLEDISLFEQINLFKNCTHITGVHGAGFTNTIYSNEAKILIDHIHKNWNASCFYNICNTKNIDYLMVLCESYGQPEAAQKDDLLVDINYISQFADYM